MQTKKPILKIEVKGTAVDNILKRVNDKENNQVYLKYAGVFALGFVLGRSFKGKKGVN